jgi:hypothetical protein
MGSELGPFAPSWYCQPWHLCLEIMSSYHLPSETALSAHPPPHTSSWEVGSCARLESPEKKHNVESSPRRVEVLIPPPPFPTWRALEGFPWGFSFLWFWKLRRTTRKGWNLPLLLSLPTSLPHSQRKATWEQTRVGDCPQWIRQNDFLLRKLRAAGCPPCKAWLSRWCQTLAH